MSSRETQEASPFAAAASSLSFDTDRALGEAAVSKHAFASLQATVGAAEAELEKLSGQPWFPNAEGAPSPIREAFAAYAQARHRWIGICIAHGAWVLLRRERVQPADFTRNVKMVVDLAREGLDNAFLERSQGNAGFAGTIINGNLGGLAEAAENLIGLIFDTSRNPMVRARLIRLATAPESSQPIFTGSARDLVLQPTDVPAGFKLKEADGTSTTAQRTYLKGVLFGHSPGIQSEVTVEPHPAVAEHSFGLLLQAHSMAMSVPGARPLQFARGDQSFVEAGVADGKPYLWAAVRDSNVIYKVVTQGVDESTALRVLTAQLSKWSVTK